MFGSSSPSNFFQVSLNNTHEQTCTQTYTNTPVGTLYVHALLYTDTHDEHIYTYNTRTRYKKSTDVNFFFSL